MKKSFFGLSLLYGLVLSGLPPLVNAEGIHKAKQPIPAQYIVILRNQVNTSAMNSFNDDDDTKAEEDVKSEADRLSVKHKGQVEKTWHKAVKGLVMRMSERDALALSKDPRVALVEEDGVVDINATQTPATWGLDRIDQVSLPVNTNYNFNALGIGVTAYVIDTGIRTTHSEFLNAAGTASRAVGGFTAIADGNGSNDCNGHGTHVAGTIGGRTYGVAKQVNLVAVRVLDCAGSGSTSGVIDGVNWVATNKSGPAVANMSLGGGLSTALNTAVINSINAGISYAIAAGNSSVDACTQSPASVASALTVGATDTTDTRATFSNYGSCLDIFAPGVNITSAWHTSDSATNTISGTSMASPHVAGAAALYLSAYPAATPDQVANKLDGLVSLASVDKVLNPGTGSPNKLLYTGYISTGPADNTAPTTPVLTLPNLASLSGTIKLSAATSDTGTGISKVEFYVNSSLIGSAFTPLNGVYEISWNSASLPNAVYDFTVKAYDYAGNVSVSPLVSATIANPIPVACSTGSQLLINPGFETGSGSPWLMTNGVMSNSATPAAYSGSWKAWLNGYGIVHTDTVSQQVSIPVDACSASLSYALSIVSAETTTTAKNDTLTVTVTDVATNKSTVLATYSNLNKSTGYVMRTINLVAYKGKTIKLLFTGKENASRLTSVIIDEVNLSITR